MDVKVSHFQECTLGSESVARKKKKKKKNTHTHTQTHTQKINKPLDANNLIYAVPWYKTVNNLHMWNVSFIDLCSSLAQI